MLDIHNRNDRYLLNYYGSEEIKMLRLLYLSKRHHNSYFYFRELCVKIRFEERRKTQK